MQPIPHISPHPDPNLSLLSFILKWAVKATNSKLMANMLKMGAITQDICALIINLPPQAFPTMDLPIIKRQEKWLKAHFMTILELMIHQDSPKHPNEHLWQLPLEEHQDSVSLATWIHRTIQLKTPRAVLSPTANKDFPAKKILNKCNFQRKICFLTVPT